MTGPRFLSQRGSMSVSTLIDLYTLELTEIEERLQALEEI